MRIVRSLSATTFLLAATLLPLATAHCTYQTSQTSTGGAADGGSLNLAGLNVSLLPLQPASDWTANVRARAPAGARTTRRVRARTWAKNAPSDGQLDGATYTMRMPSSGSCARAMPVAPSAARVEHRHPMDARRRTGLSQGPG